MQSSTLLQDSSSGSSALRVHQAALCGTLVLLGLSVYLIILVPNRTAFMPIWRPLLFARFATAAAALIALLSQRFRHRRSPNVEPIAIFYRVYFTLVLLGCALSFAVVIFGLHGESIETAASQLQATAWLMTTALALLAGRNHHPLQAKQWFARSVAITATQVLLPLISHYPRLQPDSAGLRKGIVVFLAFLIADIVLNWREITTKRS